jgi:WD40 repeat protein/serine/threonine protein kinase
MNQDKFLPSSSPAEPGSQDSLGPDQESIQPCYQTVKVPEAVLEYPEILQILDSEESLVATMVQSPGEAELTSEGTGGSRPLSLGRSAEHGIPNGTNTESYSLLALIGTGGCGEVWVARQNSLQRIVALKAIRGSLQGKSVPELQNLKKLHWSFQVEAQVTAQLEHPNIVPVYDFGQDKSGSPIMAMKLVRGEPWNEVMARDRTQLGREEFLRKHLEIFRTVVQAVAFAHSRSVIHRDLKPSQVMLGDYGEVLLMDWGLALSMVDITDETVTSFGPMYNLRVTGIPSRNNAPSPCGTPAYMAPEQALPTAQDISYATDVYLLGGILYYILTGAPPRRGQNAKETMRLAKEGFVTPFEQAKPQQCHPQELVSITLRALSRHPADRHHSVIELSAEIKRYLSGETERHESEMIVDRLLRQLHHHKQSNYLPLDYESFGKALGEIDRAALLWPRNPRLPELRLTILDGFSRLALRLGDLSLAEGVINLMDEKEIREAFKKELVLKQRTKSRTRIAMFCLILGFAGILGLYMFSSFLFLQEQKGNQVRLALERDLAREAQALATNLQAKAEKDQYAASIIAAGTSWERREETRAIKLLIQGTQPHLRNWEWGLLVRRIMGDQVHFRPINYMVSSSWSPSGNRIASGARDGAVHFFDTTTGRYTDIWQYFAGRLYEASYDPSGKRLLLTSFDQYALIVDTTNGAILRHLLGHTAQIRGGVWSPQGDRVLTASMDKTVRIWNPDTGQALRTFSGYNGPMSGGLFTQDGRSVIIFGEGGTVDLMDLLTADRIRSFQTSQRPVFSIDLNEANDQLAVASEDGNLRIFRFSTGELLQEFPFSDSPPAAVLFLPQLSHLAVVARDGSGSILDLPTGKIVHHFITDSLPKNLSVSPDQRLLTVSGRFSTRLFDLGALIPRSQKLPFSPFIEDKQPLDARLSIYGLTPGRDPLWDQSEKVWNTTDGITLVQQGKRRIAFESRYGAWSPDWRWVFRQDPTSLQGSVTHVQTGKILWQSPPVPLGYARFSPDGNWLAVLNPLDEILIVSTSDWQTKHVLEREKTQKGTRLDINRYVAAEMAFSPDSTRIATVYLNGRVVVWKVADGTIVCETPKTDGIGSAVAWNPSGTTLAVGSNDNRIYLIDPQTGTMEQTLLGHKRNVTGLVFHPISPRLVSFSSDGTVRLWMTETGEELLTLSKADRGVKVVGAQFTRDGKALVLAFSDGTIELHETMPWQESDYDLSPPQPHSAPDDSSKIPTLAEKIALFNRRQLLSPQATLEDMLHQPTGPTLNMTSESLPRTRSTAANPAVP